MIFKLGICVKLINILLLANLYICEEIELNLLNRILYNSGIKLKYVFVLFFCKFDNKGLLINSILSLIIKFKHNKIAGMQSAEYPENIIMKISNMFKSSYGSIINE